MQRINNATFLLALIIFISNYGMQAQNVLSPAELLQLQRARTVQMHPDGKQLLYTVYKPRTPNEAPGGSHAEYRVMDVSTRQSKALFSDQLKGRAPHWSPNGKHLAFKKRTKGHYQIFVLAENSDEAIQVTHQENGVNTFQWHPNGKGFAYLSSTPSSDKEKELKKRGYDFITFEENIKNDRLFLIELDEAFMQTAIHQLTETGNVWDFNFDQKGKQLAYSATDQKLIDQRYMFRKIHVYDLEAGKRKRVLNNVGKLGNYCFSPDGKHLAYTGALNINDHAVSQLYKVSLANGETSNLTPSNYRGHISWCAWKNNKEIAYLAHEGVYPKLFTTSIKNEKRKLMLDAAKEGIIFSAPVYSAGFDSFAFSGSTPRDQSNIYHWDGQSAPVKISSLNPQLAQTKLGKQEIIKFSARDGMRIEGLLIKPVDYQEGKRYPLIVYVHGGPESHHSNGWLSGYSTPGQVMAGKGYLVAYFNYRASTGYGVDFAMQGFKDPAGKEFDDLADGIDYLVENYGADKDRVGMAGGSYGGYASAWFATYYTDYIRAAAVFVGITNVISKKGTTDIAYEELYVHSGDPLEKQWEMNLKRSPVYHAHKSKTATLIYGGAADPRIHPSQSLELYRRMKMNRHPAVRLVQYPGEGHGNRKQVGRIDVLYRQIAWMDWYVKDLKDLDGPMPPLDISDQYGLDWEY
ncbi:MULTISPECIES: S9 family peptidase [unclassified Carboxylicivirga]|uniref:S9 family peptidase n=1 Tax=Carboxylicivirga TaxID=1628153 RepID=UPI003D32A52F